MAECGDLFVSVIVSPLLFEFDLETNYCDRVTFWKIRYRSALERNDTQPNNASISNKFAVTRVQIPNIHKGTTFYMEFN